MKNQIFITGTGAVTPFGLGVGRLWEGLLQGKSQAVLLDDWSLPSDQSCVAATIPAACKQQILLRHPVDPVLAYLQVACREAVRQAGLNGDDLASVRTGVVIGSAVGGVVTMERAFRSSFNCGTAAPRSSSELQMAAVDGSLYKQFCAFSVSDYIAREYAVAGFVTTMATGCTAGLDAIGFAMDLIETDECDIVISGASEAPLTPIVITAFENIGALSQRKDDPGRASRPFSLGRDGFVIAEAAGVVVLESLRSVERRHARALAQARGFSSRSNGWHMTSIHDAGTDLAECMSDALLRGGVDKKRVSYINAHGTSTPQNDIAETNAIKRVFGAGAEHIPVSSSKSMVGHSLGAASAIGTIACVESIRTQLVHPTANYVADALCDLDYVTDGMRAVDIDATVCNASGFSGIHSSLVLSRAEEVL